MKLAQGSLQVAQRLVLTLLIMAIAFPMLTAGLAVLIRVVETAVSLAVVWTERVVGAVLLVAVVLGVLVRIGRAVRKIGGETMRNENRGRQNRIAPRRRAEDVPAYGRRKRHPKDPDPNLEF